MITDGQLEANVCNLQAKVKAWAMRHDLWKGCQFFSYQSYFDDEPDLEEPCLTVLAAGDELLRVLREPYSHITDELDRLVDSRNGYYENDGNAIYFYTYDESLQKEAIDLFQWQWICELIKPDYTDLYHELYKYFQQRPDTTVSETFKDTFHPEFVIILHDTEHVALVMQLPTTLISGYYFAGQEVPLKALDLNDRKPIDDIIFRVRKKIDSNGIIFFRGRLHTYSLWDGRPQHCLRD